MSVYTAAVLADSPIGYWRFEDYGGVAADSAGANPGSYVGSPTIRALGAVPDDSKAVLLNGTTQYISVPHNAVFNMANGPFSITGLIKRAALGANYGILSKGLGAYYFRVRNDNFLNLLRSNQADIAVSNVVMPGDSNWHHVGVTYAGTNGAIKFYIDGADASTAGPWTPTFVDNAVALTIGADNAGGADFLSGGADEVAFFNTVLSPARMAAQASAAVLGASGMRPALRVGVLPVLSMHIAIYRAARAADQAGSTAATQNTLAIALAQGKALDPSFVSIEAAHP